ncbi:MAG: aldo/keto reductase [Cyclobacteriaceae bacterium]
MYQKYKRFIDAAGGWESFQQLLNVLSQVAKKNNTSMANVASRFMMEQPAVGGVIIGARLGKSEHIQENQSLLSFSLDEESKKMLRTALTNLLLYPVIVVMSIASPLF